MERGFTALFDGESLAGWRMSTIRNQPGRDDPGRFIVVDGALEAVPGTDIGLLWHATPTPPDFVLKLEWRCRSESDNSGVFVRFPHLETRNYDNSALVAVHFGFEVQIDQSASPDGAAVHKTGAIYGLQAPANPDALPVRGIGKWNDYEINVSGQTYSVNLNGQTVTAYQNPNPARGLPSTANAPAFIGLQIHTGRVGFRNIRIKSLP